MRFKRAASLIILLAVFLSACSGRPQAEPVVQQPGGSEQPSAETDPASPTRPQDSPPPEKSAGDQERPLPVRFRIYTGPLGFRLTDTMRELGAGESTVMGLEPFDMDLHLPGMDEKAARKAVSVEGATLLREPTWLSEGGLALQVSGGQANQVVKVTVQAAGYAPAVLTVRRAGPASVTLDQRIGHTWEPVTVLNGYTTPGPSAVRLNFSKPVRKEEVEKALLEAQSVPIRGLMAWTDDQTLTWQIAELPPRLDFLLGGAHDLDGLPLPGGIPSLRFGEPPAAVTVDLSDLSETVLGIMPPDLVAAGLSWSRQAINLIAWSPGTTKWDWRTVDLHFDLEKKTLRSGRVEEIVPRLPEGLENWVASPNGSLVASLKSRGVETESFQSDLVITDLRGGRSQVFPGVIGQYRGADQVDLTTHLAWSPDGLQVAALSYSGQAEQSDLILVNVTSGERVVAMSELPVRSYGTHLAWSTDWRYLLAGNMLINQESKQAVTLPGDTTASGFWEPGGNRLLYSPTDWGPIYVVDPETAEAQPLGEGMLAGWAGPGQALLIRWNGNETRYLPPGQ